MAKYNEILVGRHNKLLTKSFSMKGPAPAPQLSGDIQPSWNIWHGIEDRALHEWYRFGISTTQVAVAAQAAGVRFRNPLGSNRIIVFEKIFCASDGPSGRQLSLESQTTNADLSTVQVLASNLSWDKRLNVAPAVVESTSNGVASAAALSLARQVVFLPAAGGNYDFILEEQHQVILSPGEAIQIRDLGINEDLLTTWWWRERFMEESEANA